MAAADLNSPRMRFNSGYWSGRLAQDHLPMRTFRGIADALNGRHFDAIFQQGVLAGFDDKTGAESSDAAWKARKSLRKVAPWMVNVSA